ncbi:MAG: GNAT family N-acetyltransferase [Pseudomonadota bacterium]
MKYASYRSTVVAAQTLANAPFYAKNGSLDVRLASSEEEILAAQALRYSIFYEEMDAIPDARMARARRDVDDYDMICDHLLVIDHDKPGGPRVVGTYRLLRQLVAQAYRGFYSASEYDLTPLLSATFQQRIGAGRQLLELGRSCVHKDYRTAQTINLLWRGIASYLAQHHIGYMFGCASFAGTDPRRHGVPLSYLYHEHLVPDDLYVRALPARHEAMNQLPRDAYDVREALRALPPLIKGYLRLGCFVGDGAVVDAQFNTTDVFILLPVERITRRYSDRYSIERLANDPVAAA